jgi:2-polyprenyl-6-methoxyphenol hydroxylase-like FAD-dependent oxidoreductase
MRQRHALIVGGSVGGLFAAHMLRAIGWDVTVLERHAGDLAGRGAGIGTQDALLDVMRRLGFAVDDTTEVETGWCDCLDRDGRVAYEMKLRRVTSAWARFYRPLKTALPSALYRPGMPLDAIEQKSDGVVAVLGDGSRVAGDLLIGADGLRSTVRHVLRPDLRAVYVGYVGWRVLVDESDIPAALRASIFDRYTFCLPNDGLVVAFPVPGRNDGTPPGRRSYNIVWYRPTDQATLADLSTDASGRHHAAGIPPPLIRPELVAQMKA